MSFVPSTIISDISYGIEQGILNPDGTPKPTTEDKVRALEERNEFLEECLIEMANIIYA